MDDAARLARRPPRPWIVAGAPALSLALLLVGGCVAGSLATNTGARIGETWSDTPRQQAVSGETVQLSFVLKKPFEEKSIHALGLADYCVFDIDGGGVDAEIDDAGAFRAEYTLDDRTPGDLVRIHATAYRKYGARDRMLIAGEWVSNQSPNNPPDRKVAAAAVTLEIYQPRIALEIPHLPADLDMGTARLVLRRRAESEAVVYLERPPRAGFTMTRQAGGGWIVEYAPTADQLNPTGATPLEFSVLDQAANRHEFNDELITP